MILIIDNYDSFVFNIYQYILEISSDDVKYYRNDKISLEEIISLNPSHIILSPGPKHPKDSAICLDILKSNLNIPILGVCLGHQAIGYSYGANIKKLKTPFHGKISTLEVKNEGVLFDSLPREFDVMRYHSLYIDEDTLSSEFEILAKSKNDDIIMAIRHKNKPIFGIQFHPESYFTQYGKQIISNFINYNKK
ncbi:aminodeoxychorismate synthase, glutaminase, component II [Campylobacter blaseri]|nr:aminodeoxychorismate synthase, glutaminase, component II [Campylobacter blaseri]